MSATENGEHQQESETVPKVEEVRKAKAEIFVATPAYGGMLSVNYFTSMMQSVQVLADNDVRLHINTLSTESLITRARNVQVSMFLADPRYTHLLFIDADIGFQPQAILDLIDSQFPVVGCPYPKKSYDFEKVKQAVIKNPEISADELRTRGVDYVYNLTDQAYVKEVEVHKKHFISVHELGTGFLMIKRSALLRMLKAYPDLKHVHDNQFYKQFDNTSYSLFDTMIDPDTKRYMSEDYAMQRRWRDMGGVVYMSTKWTLTHTGSHTFDGGNFVTNFTG